MGYKILNTKKESPVNLDILLENIKNRDIIYIGEFHQVQEVLSFQFDLISGLVHRGFQPSIGLEVFNVLQQNILDFYIKCIIPFEQMLSLYEMGPEGFDLNHYVTIIDIALKNRLKVIGLNIPRTVASTVAKQGLDSRELDSFSLNEQEIKDCNNAYKENIRRVYQKHPHEDISEENFVLAQSIKDEMMAETIVHYWESGTVQSPMVVITGRGHMEQGLGIPERVTEKFKSKGNNVSDVLIVAAYDDEQYEHTLADYIVLI